MANPQKENGYTSLANEIWDQLNATRISGEAMQVLGVIIRQTYGFHKKEDAIALSQFVEKTKLNKPAVCRALSKLITMNLIVVTKDDNPYKPTKYSLNKDFDTWKPLSKKITNATIIKKESSLKKDNKLVSKKIITVIKKETYKRNYKRKKESIAPTEVVATPQPIKKLIKPIIQYTPEMLEERLVKMESKEGSALDIIATYIREKPVKIENSKQLSLVIGRFARIANAAAGAYTNDQIFKAIKEIKNDNNHRRFKGEPEIDWTVETIIKKLVKT